MMGLFKYFLFIVLKEDICFVRFDVLVFDVEKRVVDLLVVILNVFLGSSFMFNM